MLSGFSYIRNGITFEYPFIASIKSILPICDEFVVAVGDSSDGTREAIEDLKESKIKIIDTVWDDSLRKNGEIFAQQSNIALTACKHPWLLHLQADEVIHENDLLKITTAIDTYHSHQNIEGFLFNFLNFFGNYHHLNDTRQQHRQEVRLIRNNQNIYSYKDSQGFRKYASWESYTNKSQGQKLTVKRLEVNLFHYNFVRSLKGLNEKIKYFDRFWHADDELIEKYSNQKPIDYYNISRVKKFKDSHPAVMQQIIKKCISDFDPNKIKKDLSLKERFHYFMEDSFKMRLGEYKNFLEV